MSQANRLRELYLKHGYIFVSTAGYVSIEVYSADVTICDYVAQMLRGTVKHHLSIRKVAIHNLSALVTASQKLLEIVYDDEAEELLRLVLEYATGDTKAKRDDTAKELRMLLIQKENK